jgi:hypothetical protein
VLLFTALCCSSWEACNPLELFDAPIVKNVSQRNEGIVRQLRAEARNARVRTHRWWLRGRCCVMPTHSPRMRQLTVSRICPPLAASPAAVQALVLWLDCDREGEAIGFEVRRRSGCWPGTRHTGGPHLRRLSPLV